MEKKIIDTLHVMLCGEIEDIAKQGKLTHETLDILKDLVETYKDLGKIKKLESEKEEFQIDSMGMDRGYSQRKYFIDADYQPGMNSYRGNSYMDNSSYARGGMGNSRMGGYDMYAMDGGNSYMYYGPRYDMGPYSRRGYSRTMDKEDIVMELKDIMRETNDEKVKSAISEVITKIK